jgi:L-lactate utilization protein LutC
VATAGEIKLMSREQVLARIRQSLRRREALDDNVVRGLVSRSSGIKPHVQPAYDEDLTERLVRKHEALHGSVERIEHVTDIVNAVVSYLRAHQLPEQFVAANREPLNELPWGDGVQCRLRPAQGDDRVALSVADAAIAETGTLVLVSSAHAPMSHNYLPEHHVVVVRTSSIVRWQEDVWRMLRQRADFPPRGIAMISGPSKTADVEQTIEYGAHGPRNVHMILLSG